MTNKNNTNISPNIIDNYKNTLAGIMGYTQSIDEDKIDLYEAQRILDNIHEDEVYTHTDSIETKLFSVADAMGLEKSIVNTHTRRNDELNTAYMSCFIDVLQVTVSQYYDKLDKAA